MSEGNCLDFVCVGPQRTASSWLHKHLVKHPELSFPQNVKETMFFDERYRKGMDWYWQHFDVNQGSLRCGEISPTYFDSDLARERLRLYEGLKIIVLVRNPIERTYSLFRHHRSKGRVPDDYLAAVEQMPRIETSGRYAYWCTKWEVDFGRSNMLYLFQEQIESEPQTVIDQLCDFLSVERMLLAETASERFGQATQPKWPLVTKVAAAMSTHLRSMGLHRPIEIAKRMGLRSLLIGNAMGDEEIPSEVRDRLSALYRDDFVWIEEQLEKSIDC